jgi:PQQ-dependent dehydrogenase (methanol/ethanol family)
VAQLAPAWVVPTGTKRGLEATPLVVDGVLYTTLTWSVVLALDPATGREIWRHDPQVPKAWGRNACCDAVNRGVAVWNGRVYVGTLDGRLVALDAKTGRPDWEVLTIDRSRPYTITGAPRVAKGLVFIGNGGAEFGVRGYVSAYDAETGALRWRFYTVPGPPDQPYEHPELARAAETWPADATWESGLGGTVWDSMAFDPELDLLYIGVGNSSPYNRAKRSPGGGDNLFLSSILALRPGTGELVWHYQTTPGENWDYTATQHMILADLEIGGRVRKLLMQAPKNGFFYVLDRETGELLSADKYVSANWASHVDLATGRPVETGRAEWKDDVAMVMPGPTGGHNWHPMSYSPKTRLVYIPSQEMAYPYHPDAGFRWQPGRFNTSEDFAALSRQFDGFERALRFCSPTHVTAWDPVARRRVWRVSHRSEVSGGILSTAGGLVFKGSGDGVFVAYRDSDGQVLWESDLGIGIMAAPVSYAVGGEQYLVVMVGAGGSAGLNYTFIDYENTGYVVAYKLGGSATLPRVRPREKSRPQVIDADAGPGDVERGQALYAHHCTRCHGLNAHGRGLLPDLRHASRDVHDRWEEIVLSGTRAGAGMASFADVLSREDSQAVHAYVISQALRQPSPLERAALWLSDRGLCVPAAWLAD